MTSYKLVYFGLKGRAYAIRILFALSGESYEDVHIDFKDWPSVKPTLPFMQGPVLEVTENSKTVQIAQSHAITRYLANKFNLAGKTDIEKAIADMIHEQVNDIFNTLVNIYRKPDSEEKKKDLEKALNETVPNNLKLIQNLLEKNKDGNGYLVGDSLTYADVVLICLYDWLREHKNGIIDKLPLLKQHEEKIRAVPKIAEFLGKYDSMRLTILFPN